MKLSELEIKYRDEMIEGGLKECRGLIGQQKSRNMYFFYEGEELYGHFTNYRDWERRIHPTDTHSLHREYWEPCYRKVEEAHASGDETELKTAISNLVDAIIHD